MNSNTFNKLQEIHQKYGPQEFGKICQKLLAIAFHSGGYGHVVERGVQGVDVDAAREGGEKYSLEVKTTEKDAIVFGRKDEEGLSSRAKDGYRPLLAVLQVGPLSEWYFVESKRARVGTVIVESLRPYRQRELERVISPLFEDAVEAHHSGIMKVGQEYLDNILRGSGVRVEDK
jgi:hypothetical protein